MFDGQIRGEIPYIFETRGQTICIGTPQSIPIKLDLLIAQEVIAPVTEATVWCVPTVVTPKKNTDGISMCVDLSHLNKYVIRECYQSLTPTQAV